jgi:hypothetical protein
MNYKELSQFVRFIPKDGLTIFPDLVYRDVNDISEKERFATKKIFGEDPEYTVLSNMGSYVPKGTEYRIRLCTYVYKGTDHIGNIMFTEFLDNPNGYGKKDFHYVKWIEEKYRHTKYSRYIIGDLIHILFKSGIANRLYSYMPAKNTQSTFFFDQIGQDAPCVSKRYPSDSPDVQKYILSKGVVADFPVKYVLIEFNGDIYRGMDLEEYLMASPNRKIEDVRKWLVEMDKATKMVRDTFYGCSSS